MMNRLMLTSAIAGMTFFVFTPAYASCTNYAPGNSTTSTCTGITTTAINSNAISSQVDMAANAQLNVTGGPAITLGTNGRINLNGAQGVSSISSDQTAIVMGNGNINLFNGSTISGNIAATATNALTLNVGGGTITATTSGLNGGANSTYSGTYGGSLTVTGGAGITFGANSYVSVTTNSIINASTTAVAMGNNGNVIVDATVTGGTTGVSFAGGTSQLSVSGTLTGTGGTAADMASTTSSIFTLGSTAIINGNVNASTSGATDEFRYDATTDTSFAINTLGTKYNDFERFIKQGTGTTTLTGISSYTGTTAIDAGLLAVNGTLTSTSGVAVNNDGTLGGSGTVRNVTVNSGGKLAPGNSIGTLNVTGTLDFAAGSRYAVEYDNNTSDKTIASAAVTINSAAILDLTGTGVASTYTANTTHTILQGSSVTGTFGTLNNNLAFLTATQENTGTSLNVKLARNDVSFADVVSPELKDAANALNGLGGANTLVNTITGLDAAAAASAIRQLAAQQLATTPQVVQSASVQVLNGVGTRIAATASTAPAATPSAKSDGTYIAALMEPAAGGHAFNKAELWGNAIGGLGRVGDDGATPGQKTRNFGFVAGMDRPYGDAGLLGVYAGYVKTRAQTDQGLGETNVGSYQMGLYGTRRLEGGLSLSGGLGGSYNDIDTERNVTVGGLNFKPTGDTHGTSLTGYAELSKPMVVYNTNIAPFANIGVTHTRTSGFTEENGGAANLKIDDSKTTNPTSTLGARFGKQLDGNGQNVNVTGKLGWQHTYGDVEPATTMQFASGSTSFQSTGLPITRDAAVIGLDLDTQLSDDVNGFAGYNGTLSKDSSNHGFTVGAKMKF